MVKPKGLNPKSPVNVTVLRGRVNYGNSNDDVIELNLLEKDFGIGQRIGVLPVVKLFDYNQQNWYQGTFTKTIEGEDVAHATPFINFPSVFVNYSLMLFLPDSETGSITRLVFEYVTYYNQTKRYILSTNLKAGMNIEIRNHLFDPAYNHQIGKPTLYHKMKLSAVSNTPTILKCDAYSRTTNNAEYAKPTLL